MYKIPENKINPLIALCKMHHVTSLALFGSAVKNKINNSSDLDFLVQFSEDLDVLDYADNYFGLLEGLENLFGRKIDLLSKTSIKNPVLIEEIAKSKVNLYAA